jgi:hypothetical protein
MSAPEIVWIRGQQLVNIKSQGSVMAIGGSTGRRMNAPLRSRAGNVRIIVACSEYAEEQVVIFVTAQTLIKAADIFESGTTDQCSGWLNDDPLAEKGAKMALRVLQERS